MQHYALNVTSAPAMEPVSLEQAKLQCRIDGTDEDALLSAIISAARKHIEDITGRSLVTQTVAMSLDAFPCGDGIIRLPRTPVASVSSVTYVDEAGATQTLAAVNYLVDAISVPARLAPAYGLSWPTAREQMNAVTVTFVAGQAAGSVDKPITQAMLLLIGHWYINREAVLSGTISKEIEFAVGELLAPYRLYL